MIKKLNNLVANGQIKEVLDELKLIFKSSDKLNEIILQSARYNDLKEKIRKGILDYENASISKNKITLAILELISEIDEALETNSEVKKDLEKYNVKTTINQNHSGTGHNIGRDFIINNK